MKCRVPGCVATDDTRYSGRPVCEQPFGGDPQALSDHLRDCMVRQKWRENSDQSETTIRKPRDEW